MKKSRADQAREKQLELFENALSGMDEKFVSYHRDNPQIFDKFVEIAIKAIVVKKFQNLSAEFIFNIIRWETPITAVNDIYKINNNYKAFYSRLFMVQYPQHEGFFRTRQSKADDMDMHTV